MSHLNDDHVYAIVLAAGSARRFGSTKQLAELQGEPLVRRAVKAAERVCGKRSLLVAGNDWGRVTSAAAPQAGFFAINEDHEAGLSASIRCGVRAVADVASAVLLLLADQPLLTVEHLQAMRARWRSAPDAIVATAYGGVSGAPTLFPARDFSALMALDGDAGARNILLAEKDRLASIDFEAAAVDIDTPEDLERLKT